MTTQVPTTAFVRVPREAWYATTPQADGTMALPAWMTMTCVTTDRTIQTSATTGLQPFGADAARGDNIGNGWGIAVEDRRYAHLITVSDGTGGTTSSSDVLTDIFGDLPVSKFVYDGTGLAADACTTLSIDAHDDMEPYVMSMWVRTLSESVDIRALATPLGVLTSFTVTPAWQRIHVSTLGNGVPASTSLEIHPAASNDAFEFYYCASQIEDALAGPGLPLVHYPTSFLPALGYREPDVLAVDAATALVDGFWDLEIVYAPYYASADTGEEKPIVYFGPYVAHPGVGVFFDGLQGEMQLIMAGGIIGLAITFSERQVLRVRARATAGITSLEVIGATTGDGVVTGIGAAPFVAPGPAYLLGNDTGPDSKGSADLISIAFYEPGG